MNFSINNQNIDEVTNFINGLDEDKLNNLRREHSFYFNTGEISVGHVTKKFQDKGMLIGLSTYNGNPSLFRVDYWNNKIKPFNVNLIQENG